MIPARSDGVENWLRRWRDAYLGSDAEWFAINDVLDDYVLHADMGMPLTRVFRTGAGLEHTSTTVPQAGNPRRGSP